MCGVGGFALAILTARHDLKKGAQWVVSIIPLSKDSVSKEAKALAEQHAKALTIRSSLEEAERDMQGVMTALQKQTGHVVIEMDESEWYDAWEGQNDASNAGTNV